MNELLKQLMELQMAADSLKRKHDNGLYDCYFDGYARAIRDIRHLLLKNEKLI